jgi:hypothetical protein
MTLSSRTSPLHRVRALASKLVAGCLFALPLACAHVGAPMVSDASRSEVVLAAVALECPVGSLGCPCTAGGGCDPGLVCMSGYCDYPGEATKTEYEYEFEDDVLMLEAPAPRPAESKRVTRSAGRKRGEQAAPAQPSGAVARDVPTGPATLPVDVTSEAGETSVRSDEREEPDDGRLVIYTAGLDVAVYELEAAIELAERVPERFGGWIESRHDYQITLRVPAERLFEVIERLSELGLVLGKSLRADDVTAEYTDLASRILVLEQLVEQLELLLAQAKTVEEALKIRIELDRVRLELESARTRMRALSEMIDFSTLTLRLSQRGDRDVLPSSNDPFPWVDDLGVETTEYR